MPAHREASVKLRERGDRGTPYLQVVRSGVFKRLGGEFVAASRPTRGILLVLSNCKDPAREAAFNRWYEDIHVADILETGAFHTAYRYESVDPPRRRPRTWLSTRRNRATRPRRGRLWGRHGPAGRSGDGCLTPSRWWLP
jgi:hypothetical protein